MAYTIEFSSGTGLQGASDDIYYVVRDTVNNSEPKFRYLLRVTIDSVVIGTFKQLPNNSNAAAFLIQNIVNDYVKQDADIWEIGTTTTNVFADNNNALKTVSLEFGYEKALTQNDAPTQTFLPALNTSLKVINGSLRSQLVDSNEANSASNYAISGSTKQFLSVVPPDADGIYHQDIITNQSGALAFLNGDDVGSADSGFFHVTYYNDSGAVMNTGYFTNTPTQGGFVPAASLTDSKSLLYIRCFPKNLEIQTVDTNLKPSNNANFSYYDVQAASSTTLSGNESSAKYRFHNLCNTRYNIQNVDMSNSEYFLYWWNEVGGVDNLLLDGASQISQSVKRTTYRTIGNNAFLAGAGVTFKSPPQQGGLKSAKNLTTTTLTLNTREQNPERLNYLIQSLVNSPSVYIRMPNSMQQPLYNVSSDTIPIVKCVVVDTQMKYNSSISDKLSSYTITIEISKRKPTIL